MKKEQKIIEQRKSLYREGICITESKYKDSSVMRITFRVIIPLKEESVITKNQHRYMVCTYDTISEKEWKDTKGLIKPRNYTIEVGTLKEVMQIGSRYVRYGYYEKMDFITHENVNPADYKLAIPDEYEVLEVQHEVLWDDVTLPIKEKIEPLVKTERQFLYGLSFDNAGHAPKDEMKYLYCSKCRKTYTTRSGCPVCRANQSYYSSMNVCVDESLRKFLHSQFDKHGYVAGLTYEKLKATEKMYFMTSTDTGIKLYKILYEASMKNGCVTEKYVVEYSIEHTIEKKAAYKHLKKGLKEVSAFDALGLNSNNIMSPPPIIYDGCENFMEFAMKNEDAMKKIGFIDSLKYTPEKLDMEAYFLVFIGILNKYPVMEMIIKMGYAKLFFESYKAIKNGSNAEEMARQANKIADLVNNEATKGKHAMRIPLHIGDYLIKKSAGIDEYFDWVNIYELTDLTKEQFENIINSIQFAYFNSQVSINELFNIMKYGYPFQKLMNYLVKVERQTNRGLDIITEEMADYLQMCEFCGIEADQYPSDLKKQHDDMLLHMTKTKTAKEEKMLAIIGTQSEKCVEVPEDQTVGIPKILSDYVIVFPKSEKDFIEEGNMQHNCVGSYPRRVKSKDCIIFFIRKKDTPNKSFITAECTKRGLGQFYYSNNRPVNDEELIKLGKYISNKLLRGCKSGAIDSLNS